MSARALRWLALLVPLWLVCFGLSVVQMARGELGYVYLTAAAESPDRYPRIGAVRFPEVAAQSGLRAGDRLIRAGRTDLRGTGPFSSHALILAEAQEHRVPIVYERGGERRETVLDTSVYPPARLYTLPFISLVSGLFASLLLLRAPRDRRTPSLFVWYMAFAIMHAPFLGESPALTYASYALYFSAHVLIPPVAVFVALAWRDRPASPLVCATVWLLALNGPARAANYTGFLLPSEIGLKIFSLAGAIACILFVGIFVSIAIWADKLLRRQLSWLLLGMVVGLAPVVFLDVAMVFEPGLYQWREVAPAAMMAIPITFFIAIVRYDLLDIHRIMSATAAYTLLGIASLTGLLAVVPRVARAATETIGIPTDMAQVMLSLALAAVLVPAYRVLRPQIDRIFFKERDAIQRGIDKLLYDLSECGDPEAVTELAASRLDALLQPDVCASYARSGEVYGPVFARGSAVPPALAGEGPLIEALDGARGPVNVERWRRRRNAAELDPAERAFLETLGARVFVPVHHRGTLALFMCLGTKRSGDIYSQTELALLGRVADRVAAELGRFQDAEIIRQGHEMQESLRRYVPGAIAEQLSSGDTLEAGEREVSVLFVDIRGYTSYSESRRAEEIFTTISRYTETVSEIVRKHGGSVVEFNGDGMMAVFGAPRELAGKERAAVRAGREMVAAVAAMPVEAAGGEEIELSVGVGIATGEAYVGNIQAVDRMIWSAIGNTTNLAARLQSLTRDLDAAVVIDAATRDALADEGVDFEKRADTPIRGRSQKRDVYALSLSG